jgi:hypothetical protein
LGVVAVNPFQAVADDPQARLIGVMASSLATAARHRQARESAARCRPADSVRCGFTAECAETAEKGRSLKPAGPQTAAPSSDGPASSPMLFRRRSYAVAPLGEIPPPAPSAATPSAPSPSMILRRAVNLGSAIDVVV